MFEKPIHISNRDFGLESGRDVRIILDRNTITIEEEFYHPGLPRNKKEVTLSFDDFKKIMRLFNNKDILKTLHKLDQQQEMDENFSNVME